MNRKRILQSVQLIYATTEYEIDCNRCQALLPRYVEGEIAGEPVLMQYYQVRAHLIQCPDCAEEYEGLRQVAALEARDAVPTAEESLEIFEPASAATVPTRDPESLTELPEIDPVPAL